MIGMARRGSGGAAAGMAKTGLRRESYGTLAPPSTRPARKAGPPLPTFPSPGSEIARLDPRFGTKGLD